MWTMAATAVLAQDTPEAPSTGAFHDELARAKSLIFEGDSPGALSVLDDLAERLHAGEPVPDSLKWEARVYRGDLQYGSGDTPAARASFRAVLLEEPEYNMSPYHHGQDVRAFFSLVRDAVRRELSSQPQPEPIVLPPPAPNVRIRHPLPIWGYTPFGIPQLAQGRAGAGVAYASAQGVFAATSIGTYVWIVTVNKVPAPQTPRGWTEEQLVSRVRTARAVQVPATAAFYGTWLLSAIDGAGSWKRSHRATTVRIAPSGVEVTGSW